MKELGKLIELSKEKYVSPYAIILFYLGLGQNDKVFEWLEKACEVRDHSLVFLKVNPHLDSFRSDPKFPALLKKIGLRAGIKIGKFKLKIEYRVGRGKK